MYTTKRFKSWNNLRHFVSKLSEDWIFRGQANSTWDLTTSLERASFTQKYDGIELSYLTDFQRGARNFLAAHEQPNDLIEWLALMQHHGAPTRLLDFTKSPFIAAYFAFENIQPKVKSVSIWAINITSIREKAITHLFSHFKSEFQESHNQLTDEIFSKIFYRNDCDCILPVEPFTMNQRYFLQQSVFVSPGNSLTPLMEQLDFLPIKDVNIFKLVVPSSIARTVQLELQKMNITRTSLFPGLDGYAKYMAMKYENLSKFDELIEIKTKEIEFLEQQGILKK